MAIFYKVITSMMIRLLDDRTYFARSAFSSFATLVKVIERLFMASLHSQPMCSLDIFVDIQPFGYILKLGLFDPPILVLGGTCAVERKAHSIDRPWFPNSSILPHINCMADCYQDLAS